MRNANISRLTGSITALATPFRDGRIDEGAVVALVERQIRAGTAALVVCGSTGEAAMLSLSEHARLVRLVAAIAAGRIAVIAGCTATATDVARGLAVASCRAGADALLLAPPPYVKPTQAGIMHHVRAVGEAAELPVILYDVPSRVGVAIADETVATLYDRGHIAAIKDATGDLDRPRRLRRLCGVGLAQFSGEDAQAVQHRAMGGAGCISVTANLTPALCARMHKSWDRGDIAEVERIAGILGPLHAALFMESNPIPLKAALGMLGLCGEALRAPLTQAADPTRQALRAALTHVMPQEVAADSDHLDSVTPRRPQLRLVG
jgi:4-hydroxy-tetrahydrodipicolinate synthase